MGQRVKKNQKKTNAPISTNKPKATIWVCFDYFFINLMTVF